MERPRECFGYIYAVLCGCSHWPFSFSVDIALAWPLWGSVGTHAVFSPCSLLFPGDIEVDFPMPGVPSGPVPWWLSLSRAAQVYQLLCQGVRLYAPLVHTVQGRLCALQDPPAPRQDQVLQVHLGPCRFWGDDEWVEWGESLHSSQALKDLGDICGAGLRPFAGEGSRKSGRGQLSLSWSQSHWAQHPGQPTRGFCTGHWLMWTLRTVGLLGVTSS